MQSIRPKVEQPNVEKANVTHLSIRVRVLGLGSVWSWHFGLSVFQFSAGSRFCTNDYAGYLLVFERMRVIRIALRIPYLSASAQELSAKWNVVVMNCKPAVVDADRMQHISSSSSRRDSHIVTTDEYGLRLEVKMSSCNSLRHISPPPRQARVPLAEQK